MLLLKINYDFIVIKPISSISHSNCRAANARENARARTLRAILREKLANKTGLNGPSEKADQFK